jgi:hypothetical protein
MGAAMEPNIAPPYSSATAPINVDQCCAWVKFNLAQNMKRSLNDGIMFSDVEKGISDNEY